MKQFSEEEQQGFLGTAGKLKFDSLHIESIKPVAPFLETLGCLFKIVVVRRQENSKPTGCNS